MRPLGWPLIVALVAGGAGCGNDQRPGPIDQHDAEARERYPDLAALHAGEQGIYRGCGPNGGVCHNGSESPNLASLGSVIDSIGVRCNQNRDNPQTIDDLCEREGDYVLIAGEKIELGYFEAVDDTALDWRLWLRTPPPVASAQVPLEVYRRFPMPFGGSFDVAIAPLSLFFHPVFVDDPNEPTGRAILVRLLPDANGSLATIVQEAGGPRPDRYRLGDPNRNGTFGRDLGAGLIVPGDPAKSYLLRRLTDPHAGPLMPRANCCAWTQASLRALWCWVDGLAPDGGNALAPIDYERCRASPPVELLYPKPGPMCEAQGLCPVEAAGGTGEPTFSSIYSEVLVTRCAGAGCHDTGAPGGVDLRSAVAAYETLADKIVPGDPAASVLYRRIDPTLCTGACQTMPLGRPALAAEELERIHDWIAAGAADD